MGPARSREEAGYKRKALLTYQLRWPHQLGAQQPGPWAQAAWLQLGEETVLRVQSYLGRGSLCKAPGQGSGVKVACRQQWREKHGVLMPAPSVGEQREGNSFVKGLLVLSKPSAWQKTR